MNNDKIAVFFDCENIKADYVQSIFDELAQYGEIIIKQSFKDWNTSNHKSWNQDLHENFGIEPIQVFKNKNLKNSCDARMQRAVLETIVKPFIDYIVLVSSDSDFRDLAMNVRSNNIKVIGFGESKTPDSLRNAYTTFIELPIEKELSKDKDIQIIKLLKDAITNTKGENDYSYVSQVGTYLKNKNSSNNPKNFGVKTWGEFLKKYPDHFECKHLPKEKSSLIVSIKN